jgi:hypothetical protein
MTEAERYLPNAAPGEAAAFEVRQLAARQRYAQLVEFYRRCPCRVARIHLLTGSAVTLGRFCGVSETFDRIGALLMPVDAAGEPKSAAWRAYRDGCVAGLPWDLRDDQWMTAHLEDMERLRSQQLDQRF